MRKRRAAMAAGLLALASCGGESGDTAKKAEGASAGAAVQLQAGQWEVTHHTLDISAPGMPAGAADMLKPGPVTVNTCITPEQAQKPGPDLFSANADESCKQEGFKAAGGEVSGTLTCTPPGGGKTVMKLDGSFDVTEFDVHMEMVAEADGTQTTTKMRTSARRTGDCPSGAQAG